MNITGRCTWSAAWGREGWRGRVGLFVRARVINGLRFPPNHPSHMLACPPYAQIFSWFSSPLKGLQISAFHRFPVVSDYFYSQETPRENRGIGPPVCYAGNMKITQSTKYLVREVSTNRAVTNGANRREAHAVVRLLGEKFYVYNRVTRRRSNEAVHSG